MRYTILFKLSKIRCRISVRKLVEYATRSDKTRELIVTSFLKIKHPRMHQNVKQSEQLNGFERWNSENAGRIFVNLKNLVIPLSKLSINPDSSISTISVAILIIVVKLIIFHSYFLTDSLYVVACC